MARYILRRLPSAVIVLVLASIVIFALIRLVPGDPAISLVGQDATPEQLAVVRGELGLDKPVVGQYFTWVGNVATFRLGRSYVIGGEVSELVERGAGNTLVLAAAALLLAIVLTLLVSISSVLFDRPWLNTIVTAANTAALALPPFVTGPLLVILFAVANRWLPAGETPPEGVFANPGETLRYLVLPTVCLGLPVAGALTRFLTEALRTQMLAPYVVTARALGIPRRRIVLTQVLPNALPAAVTALGIQIGYLLGGTVLVEVVFAWPGLGHLAEQAITGQDYPVVQILLLLSVFVFVVIQLVSDVVYAYLDPRIRLGGETT